MSDEKFTSEQLAIARQKFAEGREICPFCGGFHLRFCPRVREIELNSDGSAKRIAYWAAGEWDDDYVIWPEMIAVDDEDEGDNE